MAEPKQFIFIWGIPGEKPIVTITADSEETFRKEHDFASGDGEVVFAKVPLRFSGADGVGENNGEAYYGALEGLLGLLGCRMALEALLADMVQKGTELAPRLKSAPSIH